MKAGLEFVDLARYNKPSQSSRLHITDQSNLVLFGNDMYHSLPLLLHFSTPLSNWLVPVAAAYPESMLQRHLQYRRVGTFSGIYAMACL
jgi:hypothetical protein